MPDVQVQFGGKQGAVFDLRTNEDFVVVRTWDRVPLGDARLSARARSMTAALERVTAFADAGVEVFRVRDGSVESRDAIRETLRNERDIRFAGRVLSDIVYGPQARHALDKAPTRKPPVLYSENLFVKFSNDVTASVAKKVLAAHELKIKQALEYAPGAYFAQAPEGIGLQVFNLALRLLRDRPEVELCHPELLRIRQHRSAFVQQWHLRKASVGGADIDAHANVEAAWATSTGSGIVIAVIDDGVDIDHEEFASNGKIVHPRDVTQGTDDPRPKRASDNHGTACAGVACAIGKHGASGVAPDAKLMPIRLRSALGSQREADAFVWAADHGADVISCSWGPLDGDWWDPTDPTHFAYAPLPDNVRTAMDYALTKGRNGKGCVICFAAGNGNESVDNDGYASYTGVIAAAACNDRNRRSVYSDTGNAVWCSFPSDDSEFDGPTQPVPNPPPPGGDWVTPHPLPMTPGIWTTDRSGNAGYNAGAPRPAGDDDGNYTSRFGGTSSACPGVAGVAALILSVNPDLAAAEVKDTIKRTCEKIDPAYAAYDANGHSERYGFGRVDALRAVIDAEVNRPRRLKRRPTLKFKARAKSAAGSTASSKRAVAVSKRSSKRNAAKKTGQQKRR